MSDIDFQTIHLRQRLLEIQAERANPDLVYIKYIKCMSCRRLFFQLFRECTWCKCPRS